MCNLYRMTKGTAEIANLFGGRADPPGNAGESIFPGYRGLVFANGIVRQMTWGFPLSLKGQDGSKLKPKPVNNARTDKLDSIMWRFSFNERRCLIPVTEFCESEGPKGAKTRTWFSLPGEDVFAVARIWRDTAEWEPAYSMVMTEACHHIQGVHDRMPVILAPETWNDWLNGPPNAAKRCVSPIRPT